MVQSTLDLPISWCSSCLHNRSTSSWARTTRARLSSRRDRRTATQRPPGMSVPRSEVWRAQVWSLGQHSLNRVFHTCRRTGGKMWGLSSPWELSGWCSISPLLVRRCQALAHHILTYIQSTSVPKSQRARSCYSSEVVVSPRSTMMLSKVQ